MGSCREGENVNESIAIQIEINKSPSNDFLLFKCSQGCPSSKAFEKQIIYPNVVEINFESNSVSTSNKRLCIKNNGPGHLNYSWKRADPQINRRPSLFRSNFYFNSNCGKLISGDKQNINIYFQSSIKGKFSESWKLIVSQDSESGCELSIQMSAIAMWLDNYTESFERNFRHIEARASRRMIRNLIFKIIHDVPFKLPVDSIILNQLKERTNESNLSKLVVSSCRTLSPKFRHDQLYRIGYLNLLNVIQRTFEKYIKLAQRRHISGQSDEMYLLSEQRENDSPSDENPTESEKILFRQLGEGESHQTVNNDTPTAVHGFIIGSNKSLSLTHLEDFGFSKITNISPEFLFIKRSLFHCILNITDLWRDIL